MCIFINYLYNYKIIFIEYFTIFCLVFCYMIFNKIFILSICIFSVSKLKKCSNYGIINSRIGVILLIIFGIDPGIAIVGYGIIEVLGNRVRPLDYGVITTDSSLSTPDRLKIIDFELNRLIEKFEPDEVAVEELFFNKNVKTVINVAQARGVEILSFIKKGIEVYEYTPLQVKQAITGYGRADKKQIQESIKMIFKLKEIPKPDDAADALSVALCHFFSLKFKDNFKMK